MPQLRLTTNRLGTFSDPAGNRAAFNNSAEPLKPFHYQ